MPQLIALFLILFFVSTGVRAEEDPISLIVNEYKLACQKMHAEDDDSFESEGADQEKNNEPMLMLDPENVYQIEITPDGKKATVLYAAFSCKYFGYPWCGVSGGCGSYLIVDDQIYQWSNVGGMPKSASAGDVRVVIVPVGGYSCTDSYGGAGYGAAPCYDLAYWDDDGERFWSQSGSLKIRGDLSAP